MCTRIRIWEAAKRRRRASEQQLSALQGDWAVTQERILRFCERSDRILRAILGDTPDRAAWRFGPVLLLLLVAAVVASVVR